MGSGLFGSHIKGELVGEPRTVSRNWLDGPGRGVSLELARPQMSKRPTEARKCCCYDSVAYISEFSRQGVYPSAPTCH